MKILTIIFGLLLPIAASAWQEEYSDWSSITYTTYLKELGLSAILKADLTSAESESGLYVSNIKLTVGEKPLVIPKKVFKNYKLINPTSFSISVSSGQESNDVTIYFTYSGENRGSISFRNYEYSLHQVAEGS